MSTKSVPCFKAYDIRGKVPSELNEDIAYRIGRAYASFTGAKKVVVGYDIRLSSISLARALMQGLSEGGSDIFDIGLCGTEEIYFATFSEQLDGGIMVTASHNPAEYNGMKLVQAESRPISGDTGLREIESMVAQKTYRESDKKGSITELNVKESYIKHLLGYVDTKALKPLKVVVNPGNGCAGPVIDLLEEHLPFEFIKIHNKPDGTFPNGIPNPLLVENRDSTVEAIKKHGADVGIAWDGDFDRCFLFDEKGRFIEGYYIVGMLAEHALGKAPNSTIIYDPRLTWNTEEIVNSLKGYAVKCKTGHAFIKERMRKENAVYGGEMSAHHYFRGFSFCDSGMIPWLIILEIISKSNKNLSELLDERIKLFPASGEINRRVKDADVTIKAIEDFYSKKADVVDYTDGISMDFPKWRFNLRKSNTEPVIRLNVESRQDYELMKEKTEEILKKVERFS